MSETHLALLPDRGVVSVTGADAGKLLQGLVTSDVARLAAPGDAAHAALLTPQGKILFAFFLVRTTDGYLLETERVQAPGLAKRVTFYKLRADVKIADVSNLYDVFAIWRASASSPPTASHVIIAARDVGKFEEEVAYADPRRAALGTRVIAPRGLPIQASRLDLVYHAHRIALGVPEAGRDYDLGDTFPHEANFDLHHGVDFDKGCFVGQEVVARMQHKTTVRKRIVTVAADRDLPDDRPEITAGPATIGRLGSVHGRSGLAMLRLDRAVEMIDKGDRIRAADAVLTIDAVALAAYRAATAKAGAS
jgi:hypothetical protein